MKPTFVQRPIVLSIHPEFAEAIMAGTKQVELRKPPFPKDARSIIMYATSPVRYLVGSFTVENIAVNSPGLVFLMTEGKTGIGLDDFMAYYKGKKWAVAIIIKDNFRFTNHIDPDKYIKNWSPPQSWRYITWKEHDRIVSAGSKPAGGTTPPMGAGPKRGLDSPPSPLGSSSTDGCDHDEP